MLHRNLDVGESVLFKERTFPEGRFHQGLRSRLAIFGEKSWIQRTGVYSDTDWNPRVPCRLGHLFYFVIKLLDVAGVHTDRGASGINRRKNIFRLKMNIGNNWYLRFLGDLGERICIVLAWHGNAHDLASRSG